jgi:MFS family permease
MMRSQSMITGGTDRLPIVALVGSSVVSLVGNVLSMVALPWFVLQTTGSPAKAGLVGLDATLPGFAAGIFGGTLVDQFGYKQVSVLADVISGLAIGAIPLLYHTTGLAFWQLLALVFLGALLDVPGLTARRALIPDLAVRAGMRLERVNATFESISNLALLIGPPVAGVLIAWLGAGDVLWLDAASFAVSAGIVAVAIPRPTAPEQPAERGSYLDELLAGLRFLRGDRLLFPMAIVLGVANGLSGALFAVVLPVYADKAFGSATDLGLMVTATGAGALLGATLYASVGYRWPRRLLWVAAYLLMPIPYWVLGWSPSLLLLIMVLFVGAFATGPINPLMVTIRHERSPAHLLGRVFSTYSAIALAAQPAGVVATGYLIEGIGFRPTVLLTAASLQALALVILVLPAFRHMERPVSVASKTSEETVAIAG